MVPPTHASLCPAIAGAAPEYGRGRNLPLLGSHPGDTSVGSHSGQAASSTLRHPHAAPARLPAGAPANRAPQHEAEPLSAAPATAPGHKRSPLTLLLQTQLPGTTERAAPTRLPRTKRPIPDARRGLINTPAGSVTPPFAGLKMIAARIYLIFT